MKRFLLAAIDVLLCLGICLAYAGTPLLRSTNRTTSSKPDIFGIPPSLKTTFLLLLPMLIGSFFRPWAGLTHSFSLQPVPGLPFARLAVPCYRMETSGTRRHPEFLYRSPHVSGVPRCRRTWTSLRGMGRRWFRGQRNGVRIAPCSHW